MISLNQVAVRLIIPGLGWLAGLESDRVQAKVVDGNERRLDDVGWMDGWMGWMD